MILAPKSLSDFGGLKSENPATTRKMTKNDQKGKNLAKAKFLHFFWSFYV